MLTVSERPSGARPLPHGGEPQRYALWILTGGNALTMLGVGFVLPIMPLLISGRGGSPAFIGVFFATGLVVRAVAQYPAGWLADRFGPRAVIIGSLLVYGLGFPLYAVPMSAPLLLLLRCVQAVGGGGYVPAAAAMVGELVDDDRAAQAFGRMRAAEMFGLLVGPAVGGMVAGFSLDSVFVTAGLLCLGATALMVRLPAPRHQAAAPTGGRPEGAVHIGRLLLPAMALGIPIYWWSGTFETVWAVHLTSLGATTQVVGLSVALYAAPLVLLSSMGGRIADRAGHWRAATLAVLTYGVAATAYSLTDFLPLILGMLLVEGTLCAAGNPGLSAEVVRVAPPGAAARTQAIYQAVLLTAQVGGSLAGGTLYAWRPSAAFVISTGMCVAGAAVSVLIRRSQSRPLHFRC